MKSRITIEIEFEHNANIPYIQVFLSPSDDVRDKLIKSLTETLGHISSWFKAVDFQYLEGQTLTYKLFPIRPQHLDVEAKEMLERFKDNKRLSEASTPVV